MMALGEMMDSMMDMMPEDGPPDGHDGHSGRDDSRCSSVADDCCACDKNIGQLTCDFDEPATCYDGYVAKIPPGEDYEGSCQYSCYPPDRRLETSSAEVSDHHHRGKRLSDVTIAVYLIGWWGDRVG